jgi:hypothetical protein
MGSIAVASVADRKVLVVCDTREYRREQTDGESRERRKEQNPDYGKVGMRE